ncbi:MAG: UDP-N-acetylmuramoyl-L-alanine--D-glutamate ligase [Clostridia bacterium]|nr:UDP-N-acetylmuramoyl-L-alanine--D-glutamate ligase [Clostridia bacterium]
MEKILVMGIGKSGMAALEMLLGSAELSAWDGKPEEELNAESVAWIKANGIKCFFGVTPEEEFDRVVISPGIKPSHPVAKLGKELVGEIELAYENCKGSFIAITGTNGKTTTTTLVGEILKAANKESFTVGNIGSPICGIAKETTDNSVLVTEVSSYQLETIKTFKAHISAIINLAPDHLDRHGSAEEYYRCKERVFENQTENDIFVYNGDDEETVKAAKLAERPRKIMFTRKQEPIAISNLSDVAYVKDGMITVRLGGKETEIVNVSELQLMGGHNVDNVLCACAICMASGVKGRTIGKVLKAFKGVEHRLEFVREIKGVKFINDSKGTNTDASIRAIEAINAPIILIAGGYDKGLDFKPFIEAFGTKVRYLILLGQTAEKIAKTALECGFKDENIVKCSSMDACVTAAHRLSERGDYVLLSPACASWGMYPNYEVRGEDFKTLVKKL